MINELLKNLNAKDRAKEKGQEIAKIKSIPKTKVQFSGFECEIEITDIRAIDGGCEVLARAWDKNGNQYGFSNDGSVDLERFVFINPPIMVDDPLGDVIREYPDPRNES